MQLQVHDAVGMGETANGPCKRKAVHVSLNDITGAGTNTGSGATAAPAAGSNSICNKGEYNSRCRLFVALILMSEQL